MCIRRTFVDKGAELNSRIFNLSNRDFDLNYFLSDGSGPHFDKF